LARQGTLPVWAGIWSANALMAALECCSCRASNACREQPVERRNRVYCWLARLENLPPRRFELQHGRHACGLQSYAEQFQ